MMHGRGKSDSAIGAVKPRLIPLTQVNLYVVGAAPGAGRRFCEDCLA